MLINDFTLDSLRQTIGEITVFSNFEAHEEYLTKLFRAGIGTCTVNDTTDSLEISNMLYDILNLLTLMRNLDRLFSTDLHESAPSVKPIHDAFRRLDFDVVMGQLVSDARTWIHNDDPDDNAGLDEIARMANLYENINDLLRVCYEFFHQDEVLKDRKAGLCV